jgi:hypothetical protein
MLIKLRIILLSQIFCLVLLSLPKSVLASQAYYGWTYLTGGTSPDSAYDTAVDSSGNVFVVGEFKSNNADLDGTGGVDYFTPVNNDVSANFDAFVTKYNADGSYAWSRTWGGSSDDNAYGVATDSNGNVYVIGKFTSASVDFDGTSGIDTHTLAGSYDLFITKYNVDGTYGWTRTVGGLGGIFLAGAIQIDSQNNLYVGGFFSGTDINFNSTGGSDNHTSIGNRDIFLSKYKTDGSYLWTYTYGGSNYENINAITSDLNNNIYVTGMFMGTNVDLDGTSGTDLYNSSGTSTAFLSKYNADGLYTWSRTWGGSDYNDGKDVTTDPSGNILVSGYMTGTDADLDGTSGTDLHSSNGGYDAFVSKYKTNGDYVLGYTFGGNANDNAQGVACDSLGNIYLTGSFTGTNTDMDGTTGVDLKTAKKDFDFFLSRYNSNGTYAWTYIFGADATSGNSYEIGNKITIDSNSQIYVAGYIHDNLNSIDFDGTDGVDLKVPFGSYDALLTKYYVDVTPPLSFSLSAPGNKNYTNSERPTFKWGATTDALSGLSKYKLEINNGNSGTFIIDNIPPSRTTDYETNRYVATYEDFSDSEAANDYVAVYTKTSSDWEKDYNDGNLKEGQRNWKVTAYDGSDNSYAVGGIFFVDMTKPSVAITQIDNIPFKNNLTIKNTRPVIFGKIIDSLSGDMPDTKVASGPNSVEIKIEKENPGKGFSLQYQKTITLTETYWVNYNGKITDNTEQKSDKYTVFSFTPDKNLPIGTYRLTLVGEDKAKNSSTAFFDLTVSHQEKGNREGSGKKETVVGKSEKNKQPEASNQKQKPSSVNKGVSIISAIINSFNHFYQSIIDRVNYIRQNTVKVIGNH